MDDWIILTYDIADRREVGIIASQMRRSRFEIVGYLATLWGWFSRETPDGHVQIDVATLADVLGVPRRFLDCLLAVGWLSEKDGVLSIPHWDRWLSPAAKARHAAAYYQRFRRANRGSDDMGDNAARSPPDVRQMFDKCQTNVKHLYNDDDDDVKGEKGGPGEKGEPPAVSDICPDKRRTSEIWKSFRIYGRAWGPRGPTSKRDRVLLWRVCALAAEGQTWAKTTLESLENGKPNRPGAYLQKLTLELGPREPHVSLVLAEIPVPAEIERGPPTASKPRETPREERPLTPEEGRAAIAEAMAAIARRRM